MGYRLGTLLVLLAVGPQGRAAWFTVLCAVTWVIAAVSWPMAVYYMFKTVANRKPGLRLWHDAPSLSSSEPWWMRNPFNHILVTNNLTNEGIKCRRRLLYAALCFLIPILAVLAIGVVTDQLD